MTDLIPLKHRLGQLQDQILTAVAHDPVPAKLRHTNEATYTFHQAQKGEGGGGGGDETRYFSSSKEALC
jgi:hypothetical protein